MKFKQIITQIANDDNINPEYLNVGWRDILLNEIRRSENE